MGVTTNGGNQPAGLPDASAGPPSREKVREIVRVGGVTGVLGVVCGYAVFLLWLEESTRPWKFGLALFCAALLSFIFEWLREKIQGEHHAAGNVRARVIVTFVMLVLAELFVMSWDHAAVMKEESFQSAAQLITGHAGETSLTLNLMVLAGLWIVVGSVLGGRLAAMIPRLGDRPLGENVRRCSVAGALSGLVAAPLALLAYILAVRLVTSVTLLLFDHKAWRENLDVISGQTGAISGAAPVQWVRTGFFAISYLDGLLGGKWWSFLLAAILLAIVCALLFKNDLPGPAYVLVVCFAVIVLAPLMSEWKDLALLLVLAALIWTFPGALLGAMVPLLRRPSDAPRVWGLVAFSGGAILILITAARFQAWFLLPATMLMVAGFLFQRGHRIEDYWPIVALSMAIIISGVTFLIQQATFAGVFRPFHAINTLPATISARGSPADQGRTLGSLKLPSGDAEWLKTRESLELMDPSLADPARRIQRALEKQKELASLRNQFGEFVLEAKVLDAKLEEARKQFSKISEMEKAAEVAAPSHGTQGESAHDAETTLAERAERLHKLRGQLKDLTAQAEDAVKKLSTLVRSSYLSLGLQPLARPLTASEQAEFDRVVNSVQEGRRRLNSDLTSQIAIFKKMQHELEEFDEKSLRPAELAMVQLAARSLELCLTGSLGFWVTIGLLAGWSVARGRHPQEFPTKGAERSG